MKNKYILASFDDKDSSFLGDEGKGPLMFSSVAKAEKALIAQCQEDFIYSGEADIENWFSKWAVLKVEKVFRPKGQINVKINLEEV